MYLTYVPMLMGYSVLCSFILQCNKGKNINESKVFSVYACKIYERTVVEFHSFLTSTSDGEKLLALRSECFECKAL